MRTIELNLAYGSDTVDIIAEEAKIPLQEIFTAIGYLSQWALNGYDHVSIHIATDGDMIAHYRDSKNSEKRYTIGAVWNGANYGFHS